MPLTYSTYSFAFEGGICDLVLGYPPGGDPVIWVDGVGGVFHNVFAWINAPLSEKIELLERAADTAPLTDWDKRYLAVEIDELCDVLVLARTSP